MNTQLVESLVQVIESLSQEESALLLSKLQDKPVQKTLGVCGGEARIRNTRISVWTLVSLRQTVKDEMQKARAVHTKSNCSSLLISSEYK